MLNRSRPDCLQNRIHGVSMSYALTADPSPHHESWPVGVVLLAMWLLAGCAREVDALTARPESPLPPTAQAFRFPTPTFMPPIAATPQAAPATLSVTLMVAPTPETTTPDPQTTPYRFAVLNSDLAVAYPASVPGDRFTVHYDPESPPAMALDELVPLVSQILTHHEQMLGVTLDGQFDVYVAGTLFAAPDQALRGHSFSRLRYFQIVVDNSSASAVQRYIVAHELTHLFAWNTFGVPSSVMLSEGLAVYAGLDSVGDELLSLHDFCAAYAQQGALPHVSEGLAYQGHIRNLEHYYAAGCFVQFLIERYGAEAFSRLYPTGDFVGVYGQTLANLEAEWLAETAARPILTQLAPTELLVAVTKTKAAYLDLLAKFEGRPEQMAAYRRLDALWSAVLSGKIPANNLDEEGAEHE